LNYQQLSIHSLSQSCIPPTTYPTNNHSIMCSSIQLSIHPTI